MIGQLILSFFLYMIYISVLVNLEDHPVSPLRHIGVFLVIFLVIHILGRIIRACRTRKAKKLQAKKAKVMDYAKDASLHTQSSFENTDNRSMTWQQKPAASDSDTDAKPPQPSFLTNEEILQKAAAGYASEAAGQKEPNVLQKFFQTASGNKIGSIALKIAVLYLIFTAIGMLLSLGGSSNVLASLHWELFLIVILFLIFRFAVPPQKPESKAYADAVYGQLVPREVANVFPDATYNRYGKMSLTDVQALNCFQRMFHEKGSEDEASQDFYLHIVRQETNTGNQISGTCDGMEFAASYETLNGLYRTTKPRDGIQYTRRSLGDSGSMCRDAESEREKTLFTGLVIRIPIRRSSAEPLGLVAASPSQVEGELRNSKRPPAAEEGGNRRLRTESEEFNRLFHIYGLDDENALFLLTPDRMERLAAVYHEIYLTNERNRYFKSMLAAFYRDTLYLGFTCASPLFCFYEKQGNLSLFPAMAARKLQDKPLTAESLSMIEQTAAEQTKMVRLALKYARRIADG